MAYDKVVDSALLDSKLRTIAQAIRTKKGISDKLTLDTMPTEIASISTVSAEAVALVGDILLVQEEIKEVI